MVVGCGVNLDASDVCARQDYTGNAVIAMADLRPEQRYRSAPSRDSVACDQDHRIPVAMITGRAGEGTYITQPEYDTKPCIEEAPMGHATAYDIITGLAIVVVLIFLWLH
jgi:hypothetical protein